MYLLVWTKEKITSRRTLIICWPHSSNPKEFLSNLFQVHTQRTDTTLHSPFPSLHNRIEKSPTPSSIKPQEKRNFAWETASGSRLHKTHACTLTLIWHRRFDDTSARAVATERIITRPTGRPTDQSKSTLLRHAARRQHPGK